MSAYLHLTDVKISKYKDNPQVKYTADKNDSGRGTLRFKVSSKRRKRQDNGEYTDAWDNYTIEYRCKGDSKQIPMLDVENVRVAIRGEVSQEEYDGHKYCKLRADNVQIVRTPEGATDSSSSPASTVAEDDIPF